jgi:hypothetical protein
MRLLLIEDHHKAALATKTASPLDRPVDPWRNI